MSIKTTVFLVFCQSFLRSFFDHLGLFTPTEYWSCSHIPDAVNALATTVEMAIVGLFQLDAFKSSEISLPELPAFARLSGLRTGHLDGHPVPGRPDPGGAEYTKLRHATSQGANGMDFQAAFGLDPGHARVRDREWVETHAASPTGVGQGGVQGGESSSASSTRPSLPTPTLKCPPPANIHSARRIRTGSDRSDSSSALPDCTHPRLPGAHQQHKFIHRDS
ncbi:hypothetical protein PtB15_2B348 [Puccinia triticina]|nr:hypothetical protein PtB15_2B348 [Puccinia triticina]